MKAKTTGRQSRLQAGLLALAGGVFIATAALIPAIADYILRIDRRLGDHALYIAGKPKPEEELVFLGIDEDSLTMQGVDPELILSEPNLTRMAERFPWDRRVWADTLEKLVSAGARLVVIDLVFSEASTTEADDAFRDALRKHADKVIIASNLAPMTAEGDGYMLLEPYHRFLDIDPAPDYGYVNFWPDQTDGLLRTAFYSSTVNELAKGIAIPGEYRFDSLAGAVLRKLGKPSPYAKAYLNYAKEERKVIDGETGKVIGREFLATRTYNPISIRSLFIPDEWEARYQSGAFFKDKVVLIGPAFVRFQDNHQTPVGQLFGPQVHLQAIGTGLSDSFRYRPIGDWRGGVVWMALLGALAAACLVYLIKKPIVSLTSATLIVAGTFAASFAYARFGSTWIGPTPFAFAFFVGAFSGQTFDLLRERFERSRLHNQFRRFVSRDVADSLVNDPSIYQLAAVGRKRRVVVLFSDIRGFTSLSEKVTPEQLFSQLNEYLTAMVKIIFNHKGTLDKFIGDAILAHWGALDDGEDSDFTSNALSATHAMIAEMEKLNAGWQARGYPVLEIGIGLHIGQVLAGEIGSEQRTEFGVIGDAVNLASRLEGMTKAFSCPWLASDQIIQATKEQGKLRRIAKVRVKGREEPVDLWTSIASEAAHASYADALALFEKGDFHASQEAFETYLRDYPEDKIAPQLLYYAELYRADPPENWQGIIRFTEK
jgi:adenylate cyclase